ncbi:diacylglycerol/lipid kinase family protein [Novipirellula caenicola]|uniref:diacylglycerol/lipid kinase family protein n=1 Tax=Novipirellula caenicola TaxID=1536901 RepID=UPI0031EF021C
MNKSDAIKPVTVLVCASPKAGRGQGREEIPKLVASLNEHGIKAIATDSIEVIRQHILRFQSNSDHSLILVACGGDGTISLLADLATPEIPIVPMPMGTENLLARHFGFSGNADDVVQTILQGHDFRIDAGSANGRLFLVMASCGFDAEVVRDVHLRRRGHIQRLSYLRPILRAMSRYRFPKIDLRIESDENVSNDAGESHRDAIKPAAEPAVPMPVAPVTDAAAADSPASTSEPESSAPDSSGPDSSEPNLSWQPCWAMVFNIPCYGGGLRIEPDAIENDCLLDVITFYQGTILSGLRYVAGIFTGRHLGFADVRRQRARRVVMTSKSRVAYQLDGDYVGRLPLEIRTLPGRVCLRMPVTADFSGRLSKPA